MEKVEHIKSVLKENNLDYFWLFDRFKERDFDIDYSSLCRFIDGKGGFKQREEVIDQCCEILDHFSKAKYVLFYLKKYQLSYRWLLIKLEDTGLEVNKSSLCQYLNETYVSEKGIEVTDKCFKIMQDFEREVFLFSSLTKAVLCDIIK